MRGWKGLVVVSGVVVEGRLGWEEPLRRMEVEVDIVVVVERGFR